MRLSAFPVNDEILRNAETDPLRSKTRGVGSVPAFRKNVEQDIVKHPGPATISARMGYRYRGRDCICPCFFTWDMPVLYSVTHGVLSQFLKDPPFQAG